MIFITKILLWLVYGSLGGVFIKYAIRDFLDKDYLGFGVYIMYALSMAAGIIALMIT